MHKKRVLTIVFIIWVVLWVVFLVREDKDDQYKSLVYAYTHSPEENVRYMMGKDLYDLLILSKTDIPEGSTYVLEGFDEFSIKEVRARDYLWPLKSVKDNPDYVIIYGSQQVDAPGYAEYRKIAAGKILARGK